MIEDQEMENLLAEKEKQKASVPSTMKEQAVTVEAAQQTEFSQTMDKVKENVLAEASVSDEHFVKTIKENVKNAAVKYTEVEQEKAELSKQQVQFQQEKLSTHQQANAIQAQEDRWEAKVKRREYHFNGVKPIMNFVDINDPMNLILLYFLTVVMIPFYLISKLFQGTVGNIIAGASDGNRPNAVKGFLWTMIAVMAVCVLAACVFMFLKWQGIIL